MKVIDNFLPKEEFLKLQNAFMSQEMPWYFQPSINKNHRKSDLDCYFTHGLYYQNHGYSNYFDHVRPIVKSINPKALIRIKDPREYYQKLVTHNNLKNYKHYLK